jgi:hypothetical protein
MPDLNLLSEFWQRFKYGSGFREVLAVPAVRIPNEIPKCRLSSTARSSFASSRRTRTTSLRDSIVTLETLDGKGMVEGRRSGANFARASPITLVSILISLKT